MARLSGTGGGDDRGSCSGTLRPARHEQLCGWRARGLRWGRARGAGGAMTTENVTVLFTDMVGSTELSSSLSAEAADEVRRGHFSILRQALAEAGGTEVKNLGDGL